jgi:hypothetical protein
MSVRHCSHCRYNPTSVSKLTSVSTTGSSPSASQAPAPQSLHNHCTHAERLCQYTVLYQILMSVSTAGSHPTRLPSASTTDKPGQHRNCVLTTISYA